MKKHHLLLLLLPLLGVNCQSTSNEVIEIPRWTSFEIELTSSKDYDNAYTDVDIYADFISDQGDTLRRPAFWDGDNIWKIRFAPPDTMGTWTWTTTASDQSDQGLHGIGGKVKGTTYTGGNALRQEGLLTMSPGKRNVMHHSGKSFLVVGDTPWALPFRATKEQAKIYAADRQEKGFNAALLMSVQPDMEAEGPEARNTPQGFMRGFSDLSNGHINQLKPGYFQYLDTLVKILLDHEIVPVFQPVFHGYGWKGKNVLGNHVVPEEYVRYCKYLLARYGSQPAFWLLAGDNGGDDPGVKESGEMMEAWDCYQQPTGLHYNPCDDYIAEWAVNNPLKHCEHYNKTHQSEPWLDFQWAQTGHGSEHLYHKVERMYDNMPTKASANGEPTYEGMNNGQNGLGWWQGEEAWMQLMHGGTMGVFYGAACLWQWKIAPDEAGWPAWTDQPKSWREALDMEGSKYVGWVNKALENYDVTDMQKRPDLIEGSDFLLAKEGVFYCTYLNAGGEVTIKQLPEELPATWFNPRTGEFYPAEKSSKQTFDSPDDKSWVLLIGENYVL